uniref:Alpha/beta fold hydrolase n=1 Tax=Roseihalotalea indica TaxID=2867963 RepID=A0AA49JI43_9BACT|nr:alpha/beta fold hydrolase [Tunicatimonas sp. TK19036]
MHLTGKFIRRFIVSGLLGGLILLNAVAYNHAWRFTHFSHTNKPRTDGNAKSSLSDKIQLLVRGIENPRPVNDRFPGQPYETVYLEGRETLEGWLVPSEEAKGIVLVFHGYTGKKSDFIRVAEEFHQLGYHTLSVDFPGSGGSSGMSTSVGYHEANDVKTVFEYAQTNYGSLPVVLYGFSLGGAAVMRAISEYHIKPAAAIVEAPFGTMLNTVCNRFEMLNVPSFPFAHLLTFWGGVQQGYWAFSHNPIDYAKQVDVPVLLTCGLSDDRVDVWEIDAIYANIAGRKKRKCFEQAGHELYAETRPKEWRQTVNEFLHEI